MCGSSTQSMVGSAEKTCGKDTKQSLSKHPAGGKDPAAGCLLFYIEMPNYRRKINFTYN